MRPITVVLSHSRPGAQVRRERRRGAVHQCAQFPVFGVLHHGHVAGIAHRQLVAVAPAGRGARARGGDHVRRQAGELALVRDVMRKGVLAVEHVVVECGGQRGELLLHRLEPRLGGVGELGAAEAEIAQRVRDDHSPRIVEGGERGTGGERAETLEQSAVLRDVRVERRHDRQRGVVGVADRRRIDHGVQVADSAPCAFEMVELPFRSARRRIPTSRARCRARRGRRRAALPRAARRSRAQRAPRGFRRSAAGP
jgi:hypothetical protein